MVNIFQRARSFNPANWKEGYEVKINITDGTKVLDAKIKFSGRSTVKADNGKKYKCLQLSYIECYVFMSPTTIIIYLSDLICS